MSVPWNLTMTYTLDDLHKAYTDWLLANAFAQRISRIHAQDNPGVVAAWIREAQLLERYTQINLAFFGGSNGNTAQDND